MLRLFSSIRKTLINEGKTSRYVRYAVGEVLLIMVGILLALKINDWNEGRKERLEELLILDRIIVDLKGDVSILDRQLTYTEEKNESLLRVQEAFNRGEIEDSAALLSDLVIGARYGWTQGSPQRTTFDELLGAGKLAIIQDSNIRSRISRYYSGYENQLKRIEERETNYPDLTYQLVPRLVREGALDGEMKPDLPEEEIQRLAGNALQSPIKEIIPAELNLALFLDAFARAQKERAESLINTLESYKMELES